METAFATLVDAQFRSKGVKVFGIGLSRTGTKSLTNALNRLGFRISHFPIDEVTLRELTIGKYNLSLLDHYDGITDVTVAPFYAQLDTIYPGSKFILTMRDKEAWLPAVERHWATRAAPDYQTAKKAKAGPLEALGLRQRRSQKEIRRLEMKQFVRAATYGIYRFNRERFSYVYDLHCKNATEYFENRPGSLLSLDITAGQGWAELCPFLNLPVIDEPFAHIR